MGSSCFAGGFRLEAGASFLAINLLSQGNRPDANVEVSTDTVKIYTENKYV